MGFAAALVRGQVSLLPPSRAPEFLLRLAGQYPDVYCLADEAVDWCPLETIRYPERLERLPGEPQVPVLPAAQVAAIVFTSGTTGAPTPHVKLWGALARGAVAEAHALGLDRLPGATLVGTVPPQHMYGFESTVLLALQNRLALHGGRPFYPGDVRAALEGVPAPRVLVTTPVHSARARARPHGLPPLALVLSATAPLAVETAAARKRATGRRCARSSASPRPGMVASRRTTDGPAWRLLPGVVLRPDGDAFWAEGGHIPQPARFTESSR